MAVSKKLPRVVTAMVTPFDPGGELDLAGAQRLARRLVAEASDGILVAGSTGESPALSLHEKRALLEAVQSAVGDRASVWVGIGDSGTREAVRHLRDLSALKPGAILVTAPPYNKPPQDGLYYHYATLADETDLPIVIYNIPGRTGVNVNPETIVQLSKIPNIIGLKQANGNLEETSWIRRVAGPRFAIWSGDDSLTLPFLAVGAVGVVSVASHFVAKPISKMVLAYEKGQTPEALKIHLRLLPVFKALFIVSNPVPVKGAAFRLGLIGSDYTRPPLRPLTDDEWQKMLPAFRECGLAR